MLKPWWERWPGVLERELAALEKAGIAHHLDQEALAVHGVVRIRVRPDIDGRPLELVATFPDLYPYFRFEVQGPDLGLAHHQHPFGGTLCLVGRATENWEVDDTLASYLEQRLPVTLRLGAAQIIEEGADEEEQAEPFTDYYPYPDGTVILVDSRWEVPGEGGRLVLGAERAQPDYLARGAVLQVLDARGVTVAEASKPWGDTYPLLIDGRWVRLDSPLRENDPELYERHLLGKFPELKVLHWRKLGQSSVDVVGVVFPEEIGWRREGDAWVFLVRVREGRR